MALKLRKDIKKSSYYVWFLGAKESKGLRGSEYILPVIKHLEDREKNVEPFKVTLQVSHKGLKIIQHVVSQGSKNKPKNETIKHFIPHNTITCVYQHEDIIACILLLFNPVTKCPLHVHAYRCDSIDTATILKQQLQLLIEKPENQKKFSEIESRLKPSSKELKKVESSIGSDTGTSTRESESSEERYAIETSRVATLYDSVAAELREKFGKKNSPILLPPRDYDTVHRQKGNLAGIDLRRCLNANIVGQNIKGRRLESSGGSSGIGSDHPPSPESPDTPDFNTLDNHSTSEDDDWNGNGVPESSVYLIEGNHHVTLPRPSRNYDNNREESPKPLQRFSRYSYDDVNRKTPDNHIDYRKPNNNSNSNVNIAKYLEKPIAKFSSNKYLDRQKSMEKEREQKILRQKSFVEFSTRSKTLEKTFSSSNSDKYNEKNNYRYQEKPSKYFDDDGFDENIRYRDKSSQRYSYEEEEYYNNNRPVPKTRSKYASEEKYNENVRTKYSADDPRFYSNTNSEKERNYDQRQYFEESTTINRRNAMYRQRSPSPEIVKAPKDRFKDAKEKFLSMEKERLEEERRRPEPPISPIRKEKRPIFIKRNGSTAFNVKEQLNKRSSYDDRYYDDSRERPRPAPRHVPEEHRFREREIELREQHDRYRNTDKYDPKRRSMFSLIEEEHRKHSSEIAKEIKRRSYMESSHHSNYDDEADFRTNERNSDSRDVMRREERDRHFSDLPESDRYHQSLAESYSKSSVDLDRSGDSRYESKFSKNPQKLTKNIPGYRHSYAEPKMRLEKNVKKNFSEMLHRTNSSVSNLNGRVGIASVHPY